MVHERPPSVASLNSSGPPTPALSPESTRAPLPGLSEPAKASWPSQHALRTMPTSVSVERSPSDGSGAPINSPPRAVALDRSASLGSAVQRTGSPQSVALDRSASGGSDGQRATRVRTLSHRSQYAQVAYVRSQGLGLASASAGATAADSPDTSGKRRTSVSSVDTSRGLASPAPRSPNLSRSPTLPSLPSTSPTQARWPRSATLPNLAAQPARADPASALADLDRNPRTWLPSELAVFLAHVLRLSPKPLIEDVTKLVISHGLTGRRFLRMREHDFRELGVNVAWARIFAEARERLRSQCLHDRILGFGGGDDVDAEAETEPMVSPSGDSLSAPTDDAVKYASWRRMSKSRGRVRGMATMFERPRSGSSDGRSREPSDSGAESEAESLVSLPRDEAEDAIDFTAIEPLKIDLHQAGEVTAPPASLDLFAPVSRDRQPSSDSAPRRLPSLQVPVSHSRASTMDEFGVPIPFGEDRPDGTVKRVDSVHTSESSQPRLADVFDAAERASQGLELGSVKSRDGSMVFVKKSQLKALERRMDEMEELLIELRKNEAEREDAQDTPPKRQVVSKRVHSDPEIESIGSLGSWLALTSVGVGIVVVEVVFGRIFGRR